MYILHEAEGPKQERDWRLDYRTVSGGSTHYTGNKKKLKWKKSYKQLVILAQILSRQLKPQQQEN